MLTGLKRQINETHHMFEQIDPELETKRIKTNSISPTKISLPDWKDLKGNKS